MYDLSRCVYSDKMVISLLLLLLLLLFFIPPPPTIVVQNPDGKLCIQNNGDWIGESQSDLIPVKSWTQMIINANFVSSSSFSSPSSYFSPSFSSSFIFSSTSSFATTLRYTVCRDDSKKKGKMWFWDSNCLNLILILLLASSETLSQLLNVCNLQGLRVPVSSYYERFTWCSVREAFNVTPSHGNINYHHSHNIFFLFYFFHFIL